MALTAMTAKDWRDGLDFSTQEARRGSLVKRFKLVNNSSFMRKKSIKISDTRIS